MKDAVKKVIYEYASAYTLLYSMEPPYLEYEKGWYRIGKSKQRYRAKQIAEFTDNLRKRIDSTEQHSEAEADPGKREG